MYYLQYRLHVHVVTYKTKQCVTCYCWTRIDDYIAIWAHNNETQSIICNLVFSCKYTRTPR